ncbi:uncharacterized protein LOC143691256 [Tamandua tetradactyla]|uniref:uncharacterized protein LOC143691256 n=1 Tax=Tamandua tetradactyla TaxID=48850 RepID=UPI004053C112
MANPASSRHQMKKEKREPRAKTHIPEAYLIRISALNAEELGDSTKTPATHDGSSARHPLPARAAHGLQHLFSAAVSRRGSRRRSLGCGVGGSDARPAFAIQRDSRLRAQQRRPRERRAHRAARDLGSLGPRRRWPLGPSAGLNGPASGSARIPDPCPSGFRGAGALCLPFLKGIAEEALTAALVQRPRAVLGTEGEGVELPPRVSGALAGPAPARDGGKDKFGQSLSASPERR